MTNRKLFIGLSLIVLLTFYDLKRSYTNKILAQEKSKSKSDNLSDNENDDISSIPTPKMKMKMAPMIKFRYCQTCGYV